MNSSSLALNQNFLEEIKTNEEEIKTNEIIAFNLCESEPTNGEGLTWKEVEDCEEKFKKVAEKNNIYLPSKQDFDDSDMDKDGVLMFPEWKAGLAFEKWRFAREHLDLQSN